MSFTLFVYHAFLVRLRHLGRLLFHPPSDLGVTGGRLGGLDALPLRVPNILLAGELSFAGLLRFSLGGGSRPYLSRPQIPDFRFLGSNISRIVQHLVTQNISHRANFSRVCLGPVNHVGYAVVQEVLLRALDSLGRLEVLDNIPGLVPHRHDIEVQLFRRLNQRISNACVLICEGVVNVDGALRFYLSRFGTQPLRRIPP